MQAMGGMSGVMRNRFYAASEFAPNVAIRASRAGLVAILDRMQSADPDPQVQESAGRILTQLGLVQAVGSGSLTCDAVVPPALPYRIEVDDDDGNSRCWREPGVKPDPDDASPVPAGITVSRWDRFDDGETEWWAFDLPDGNECWLPASRFVLVDPDEEDRASPPPAP
jgi:hypothetical protein